MIVLLFHWWVPPRSPHPFVIKFNHDATYAKNSIEFFPRMCRFLPIFLMLHCPFPTEFCENSKQKHNSIINNSIRNDKDSKKSILFSYFYWTNICARLLMYRKCNSIWSIQVIPHTQSLPASTRTHSQHYTTVKYPWHNRSNPIRPRTKMKLFCKFSAKRTCSCPIQHVLQLWVIWSSLKH